MPRPKQHSDEELLSEIKRLAGVVGHSPPRKRDMEERGRYASKTYLNRFGSWNNAVRKAGYEPRNHPSTFQKRPKKCPLCSRTSKGLDYHHWRYGESELGCYLCRECHDKVHKNNARPGENPDWLLESIKNLVECHLNQHGDKKPEKLKERYNIPSEEIIECAIYKLEGDGKL